MPASFKEETRKYFQEKCRDTLGLGPEKANKSYRVLLVADLADGPRKRRCSGPIKYPKSRKNARDWDAEFKLFEDWWLSLGGSIMPRLRDYKHSMEAERAREKSQRDCRSRHEHTPHAPRSAVVHVLAQAGRWVAMDRRSCARECMPMKRL